jgi:tetratricopeptide (TPR) repeat protein
MRTPLRLRILALSCALPLAACGKDESASTPARAPTAATKVSGDFTAAGKKIAAFEAYNGGRFADALRLYDELLTVEPDNLDARINRAASLGQLGRWPEALTATDECLARNPNDPEIHINRSTILSELGRSEEALESVDRALTLAKDQPKALLLKATILGKSGKADESLPQPAWAVAREGAHARPRRARRAGRPDLRAALGAVPRRPRPAGRPRRAQRRRRQVARARVCVGVRWTDAAPTANI